MECTGKLCLGTVQFGMKYGVNNAIGRQPAKDECFEIISEALQAGIVSFDTAGAYGEAEDVLGGYYWGEYSPQIISKVPPSCDAEASEVLKSLRQSLARLGQNKIYGYLLHRSEDMNKESVMNGLLEAKQQDLAEKIGVSIYEPEEALLAVNDSRIDIIQIPYNVLDQRLDEVNFFEKAKANNKEIYARSAFLQGLLLMAPPEAEKRVPGSGNMISKFQRTAHEYDFTPAEAAMLYSLNHYGIDYVVFGVDTVDQLKENLDIKKRLPAFGECYTALRGAFEGVSREIVVPSLWR